MLHASPGGGEDGRDGSEGRHGDGGCGITVTAAVAVGATAVAMTLTTTTRNNVSSNVINDDSGGKLSGNSVSGAVAVVE
jgi:hypothetical protein